MNPSTTHVPSHETPKHIHHQSRTEKINDRQPQPLNSSPFSFKNDHSPHPPASPAGSTSSSIFQSPQGSNPVSPVCMNLPDASSYSNMSVNYNSLTSPPPKIDSPRSNKNQGHSPHVAYNVHHIQKIQQSYESDGLSSPVEFIEGTTSHTEKYNFSADHATTGRAVTPVLSSQASFPTSVASPTPRAILSPKSSIQRSMKSSTESLKPPLPILGSSEILGSASVGRDLDSSSEVKIVSSKFPLDSTGQVVGSPASSHSEKNIFASTQQPSHQPSIARANYPVPLNLDLTSASLGIGSVAINSSLSPASGSRENLLDRSDNNRASSAPPTPRNPHPSESFNGSAVSQSAHTSLKVPTSLNTTPSDDKKKIQSPSATNFPSIDNYSFEELKTLFSEKLIELSQIQSQNAQLWALVNKQRNMIFDLQKDLDGAVEQNEKYRALLSKPHSNTSKQLYSSSSPSISVSPFSKSKHLKDQKESSPKSRTSDGSSVKHENRVSSEKPSQLTPKGVSNLVSDGNTGTKINFNDESTKSISSIPRRSVESNISKQETVFSMANSFNNSKEPITPSQLTHSIASTPYQPVDDTPYTDTFEKQSRPSVSSEVVLFVKPEEIPTIWLDISTLIGKVKSAYSKKGDPVALFTMLDRESKKELWKVLKDYSSLTALDHILRPALAQLNIPKLPEKLLFLSHAPSKVDARKVGLEEYFFSILSIPNLPPVAARALCEFLSTDMIDPMDVPDTVSRREGYLTKRGKKIRGWKVRYFVIEGDHLNYYDKPGGEVQGSINLVGAKVARQNKNDPEFAAEDIVDKSFRHDFLLVEPKKKDYVRHILCGESDEDRDLWIAALMEVIDQVTSNPLVPVTILDSPKSQISSTFTSAPLALNNQEFDNGSRNPVSSSQLPSNLISPVNKKFGEININLELNPTISFEDEDNLTKEPKKAKRKGFFSSFRNRNGHSNSQHHIVYPNVSATSENLDKFQATPYSAVEKKPLTSGHNRPVDGSVTASTNISDGAVFSQQENLVNSEFPNFSNRPDSPASGDVQLKRVFGVPLQEAINLASKQVHHCIVPAIVYRCIEHLKFRDAIFEEGIFRLSGSTSTIRALKERFNIEYDVDLVKSDTFYDVHAVAGLLKLYLREIPSLILSPYLAPEFREAVDIEDPTTKILKLKSLVQELPRENRDLLCVLFSLLTEVVSHSEINKMNLRNIGIVFAQTLNISAYVLIHFLTDFDAIFAEDEKEALDDEFHIEDEPSLEQSQEQTDSNVGSIQNYDSRPLPSPLQRHDPEFTSPPPHTQ